MTVSNEIKSLSLSDEPAADMCREVRNGNNQLAKQIAQYCLDLGLEVVNGFIHGLATASSCGNQEMFEFFIEKIGVDEIEWDHVFRNTCQSNNLDIIKLALSEGEKQGFTFNYNHALLQIGNHKNLYTLNFLIFKGATDLNQGLIVASYYKNQFMIDHLNLLIQHN